MKKILLAAALSVASFGASAEAGKNFVHGQYTFRDTVAGQSEDPNRQGVNLTVGRNIGYGITLDGGVQVRNENNSNQNDTTRMEAGATYQYAVLKDIALYTRGAFGYKLTDTNDSTYYSVEPGVGAQLTTKLAVNAGYRYRTAFNGSILDKTNTVRVGAEYALNKTQAVTLGVDRSYGDLDFLGVNIGYAVRF